ncbi:MAG TPA: hypothetical protein VFK00_03320 [Rhodanobacteraceae bacterium]|nr:hypothetical protein [Rhodanobacteraceae bacterium]
MGLCDERLHSGLIAEFQDDGNLDGFVHCHGACHGVAAMKLRCLAEHAEVAGGGHGRTCNTKRRDNGRRKNPATQSCTILEHGLFLHGNVKGHRTRGRCIARCYAINNIGKSSIGPGHLRFRPARATITTNGLHAMVPASPSDRRASHARS